MSFLTRNLRQTITRWPLSGILDNHGHPTWDSPVLLNGRWEDFVEQILTTEGKTILSRSRVFLIVDVSIGDYLMLGEFGSGDLDPHTLAGAYEVKDFRKTPQLRGSDFERIARL